MPASMAGTTKNVLLYYGLRAENQLLNSNLATLCLYIEVCNRKNQIKSATLILAGKTIKKSYYEMSEMNKYF